SRVRRGRRPAPPSPRSRPGARPAPPPRAGGAARERAPRAPRPGPRSCRGGRNRDRSPPSARRSRRPGSGRSSAPSPLFLLRRLARVDGGADERAQEKAPLRALEEVDEILVNSGILDERCQRTPPRLQLLVS